MVVYTYNLSALHNISSMPALLHATNEASTGLLILLFIAVIFIVILLALMRFDFLRAFASSSFVCFILSGFLVYMDLLNIFVMIIFLFFVAGSGLLLYLEEG